MHKPLTNGLPPFRPIFSEIDTPANKLVKFLGPVLPDITQNEFTVKDSFTFVKTQNIDLHLASLDVDAFFTNIRLDETIEPIELFPQRNFFKLRKLWLKEYRKMIFVIY